MKRRAARWMGAGREGSSRGANLVEVMVILGILGSLAIGGGLLFVSGLQRVLVAQAERDAREIAAVVELYRHRNEGACPGSLEELIEARLLSGRSSLRDPWGEEWLMICSGEDGVAIISQGPDRRPQTEDDIRVGDGCHEQLDPDARLMLIGTLFVSAPFAFFVLLIIISSIDRIGSRSKRNLELQRCIPLANELLDPNDMVRVYVTGCIRWWRTTLILRSMERQNGATRLRVRHVEERGSVIDIRQRGGVVTVTRRSAVVDVEIVARMIRLGLAAKRGTEAFEREALVVAQSGPYR